MPVRAYWNTSAIAAGGESVLGVVFEVSKGHHITDVDNGLFFIETHDTLGLKFDSAIFPTGSKYKGDRVYQGKVLVKVPVKASAQAKPGKISWPLHVGYQICQEFGQEICFLPAETDITVTTEIVAAGSKISAANDDVFKSGAGGAPATPGYSRPGLGG